LLALGYLEAAPGSAGDAIDPKDGIALLADFARAKGLLAAGNAADARAILDGLVRRNPSNVPFLSRLAEAQLAAGDGEAALATIDRTLALRPRSEFLELARADALRRLGRNDEARRTFRRVLEIDPRHAPAWLGLAGLAGSPQEQMAVLTEASRPADSVVVLLGGAARSGPVAPTDAPCHRAAALVPGRRGVARVGAARAGRAARRG
jgi:predicted Zn-dependent protease